jgi:hypothetical protein
MRLPLFFIVLIFPLMAYSQSVPKRKMNRPINTPNIHSFGPSLSADGRSMVFYNTYTHDEKPALHHTTFQIDGSWEVPKLIPFINNYNLNLVGGHSLSHDGRFLYFTTKRAPSIGGFDIAYTEYKNGSWTAHTNIGLPVNTQGNEGAPSISPDGNTLYFMRCVSMTNDACGDCELYKAVRKTPNTWNPAEKLSVNGGKGAFPRILPDGKTLIFRNDPKEEKVIHYVTKWENGKWTQPKVIDWLSEGKKESSVSIPAPGNIAYYSEFTGRNHEVMMARVPEDFPADHVLLLQGELSGFEEGKPDAALQVYDAFTRERVYSKRLTKADPTYFAILNAGKVYDYSIYPSAPGFMYMSALLDMRKGDKSILQINDLEFDGIVPGNTMILPTISFEENTITLTKSSQLEILRLGQFINENPAVKLEIQVHMKEYKESEEKLPGLTEAIFDTLWFEKEYILEQADSLNTSEQLLDEKEGKDYAVYVTYHNNRTQKQADQILNQLKNQGLRSSKVTAKGYSDEKYPLSHEEEDSPNIVVILRFE